MMRQLLFISIFFLFLILLVSCGGGKRVLSQAEKLMKQYPDSALNLLESLPESSTMSEGTRMKYHLLLTQARDKCNQSIADRDSLLRIVTDYYEREGDAAYQSLCHFYQGRIFHTSGRYEEAAIAYKKAENYAKSVNDEYLLSQLHHNLGYIDYHNDVYPEAIRKLGKSLHYAVEQRDSLGMIYDLQTIGQCFALSNQPDSTLHYLEKILPLLSVVKEGNDYMTIWHNIAALYWSCGEADRALHYLEEAIIVPQNPENLYRSYVVMGQLYYELGNKEKAIKYWQLAWPVRDKEVKAVLYKYLFDFKTQEHDYASAIEYANSYIAYADSFYRSTNEQVVADVQKRYDNEVLKVSNLQYKLSLIYLSVLCILLILGILLLSIWHKKVKAELITRFNNMISQQERELESKKKSLAVSETSMKKSEEGNLYLRRLIEKREKELEQLKDSWKLQQDDFKKMRRCVDIVNGMEICQDALAGRKRIGLKKDDCIDAILYYQTVDSSFLASLEKTVVSLTPMDTFVCILFRIGLTHQQVADFLGNTSEALSRRKSRLKLRKESTGHHRIENIVSSL